jgi:hypothetical protein
VLCDAMYEISPDIANSEDNILIEKKSKTDLGVSLHVDYYKARRLLSCFQQRPDVGCGKTSDLHKRCEKRSKDAPEYARLAWDARQV